MIPTGWEPKGLKPDAIPEAGHAADESRNKDAVSGSKKLRDAILLAKGIKPFTAAMKWAPKPVVTAIKKKAICPSCLGPLRTPPRMISSIQKTVASYYSLPTASMVSADQRHFIAHPRQVAMYLASELTRHSIAEIGRRFKRDHTTVLHAIRAVKARSEIDDQEAFDVSLLRERLAA